MKLPKLFFNFALLVLLMSNALDTYPQQADSPVVTRDSESDNLLAKRMEVEQYSVYLPIVLSPDLLTLPCDSRVGEFYLYLPYIAAGESQSVIMSYENQYHIYLPLILTSFVQSSDCARTTTQSQIYLPLIMFSEYEPGLTITAFEKSVEEYMLYLPIITKQPAQELIQWGSMKFSDCLYVYDCAINNAKEKVRTRPHGH